MNKLVAPALTAALALGCSYDFHTFDALPDGGNPSGDGAADAGAREDGAATDAPASDALTPDGPAPEASAETSCAEPTHCLIAGVQCASACHNDEQTCENKLGCSISTSCVQQCKDTETACKAGCGQTCESCAVDAGCADPGGCATAVK